MVPGAQLSRDAYAGSWQRFEIEQIEDLTNAVFGAGLDVVQMPGPHVRGSLAFTATQGVLFSSGFIDGHVTLQGPLSPDAITIGIGLRFGKNSRLCLRPVLDGALGVVLPGDSHDASLTAGSLYVTATLSARRLRSKASALGIHFPRPVGSRTGLHPEPLAPSSLTLLTRLVSELHTRGIQTNAEASDPGQEMLRAAIEHCARHPTLSWVTETRFAAGDRAAIVSRARTFINAHLAAPLTLDTVAAAASTSTRTLSRAFVETLNETPTGYIQRLRLHRIRRDLRSLHASDMNVKEIAARWGLTEPGRMSGWYQDIFGEVPSATRRAARELRQFDNHRL